MSKEPEIFETADGQKYQVVPFGGKDGKRIIIRVIDLLKGSVTEMTSKNVANGLMSGGSDSFIDKADKLISDLLALTFHKNGESMIRLDEGYCDVHFSANYGAMIEILMKVVEFNGFFDLIAFLPTNMMNSLVSTGSIKT